MTEIPSFFVELSFRLQGKNFPVDHGYLLFSALSNIVPVIHSNHSFAVRPVNGVFVGNRLLRVTDNSRLRIRLSANDIPQIMNLAGKSLRLGQHFIRVGVPEVHMLQPHPQLRSRIVVIKGMMDAETFLAAAKRQLEEKKITGNIFLPTRSEQPIRRTLKIRGKEIVGFSVQVDDLSDEDSLLLQKEGIGGRQRFGCGIFSPTREESI